MRSAILKQDWREVRGLMEEDPSLINQAVGEIQGARPLHYVALDQSKAGSEEMTLFLLSKGATIDIRTLMGQTPFHLACGTGNLGVAQILRSHGANPATVTLGGRNPLHYAARGGHTEVMKFVLSLGVPVDSPDGGGWTALHVAAFEDHLEAVKLLIARGAGVTSKELLLEKLPLELTHTEAVAACLHAVSGQKTVPSI